MRTILIVILLALSASAYAGIAIYKGEQIDGLNKICYYDHQGSTYAITIKAYQVCPRTIQVN